MTVASGGGIQVETMQISIVDALGPILELSGSSSGSCYRPASSKSSSIVAEGSVKSQGASTGASEPRLFWTPFRMQVIPISGWWPLMSSGFCRTQKSGDVRCTMHDGWEGTAFSLLLAQPRHGRGSPEMAPNTRNSLLLVGSCVPCPRKIRNSAASRQKACDTVVLDLQLS